ncbi:MAG: hypothetical protein FWF90_11535 [Promicromonosporaceae bacterium]|nr:hypothetical protein [Promicromonosporaceae bacterium]
MSARHEAAKALAIVRTHRRSSNAFDLFERAQAACAEKATWMLLEGLTDYAMEFARAYQLLVESQDRMVERRTLGGAR